MYLLSDGTSVTPEIMTAFKRGLTRAYIKLGDTIISPDNYLINAKYKDEKADPETGQFIGITSMRELTIKLYNYENSFNLENQEIEYYVGALVGNEYKYINFGNFIIQEVNNEEVNEETTFTALDYMSKFDGDDEYVPEITFPTTLLGLTQDICRQVGVELGNTDFRNANMQILANPFINGENCRTILKSIAKVAFSPAYIGQDNKLYIKFDVTDGIIEYITIDDFFENKPNDVVKPLTAMTLRSSEVKAAGQTAYASQEMIEEYGINELVIEEDYLAYTDTLRNAYLSGAGALFGLTYKPLTIDLLGSIYLSYNDVIKVTNLQGNEYVTYALNNNHEFNGTLYNTISAPSLTEEEEKHKYESEDDTYKKKTAVEIDKANETITAVVKDVNEQRTITTNLTARVGALESEISEVADITDSGHTNTAYLTLENIHESEPITIKIHPLVQNISYLYPSTGLFPSSDTYLKTRTLRFTNTSEYEQTADIKYTGYRNYYSYDSQNEEYVLLIRGTDYQVGDTISGTVYQNKEIDYELPADLYYYDATHYDEFILDYGDGIEQTCIVNKKVGLNADGTTYLLNEQTTISYTYPTIALTTGDYLISLLGYEAGYIFARLMVNNIYVDEFATRVEMNSAIRQTATEINLGVDYKLEAYPTTIEMNSAINLASDQINLTVATKVGKNEIISRINQTSEQISIDASKINLNGAITANNYFKINLNGTMEAVGGKIANINFDSDGLFYSGSSIDDGFGLWKNGIHYSGGSYIIFHAGANNTNIGGAKFKIYQDGSIESVRGTIGGFTITNDSLDSTTTGMSNGHGYAFYVKTGNVTPFSVSLSGDLQCKTLLINGAPTMKTSGEGGKQIITYYVDGNQLITTTENSLYVVLPDSIISDRNKKKEINPTDINGLDIIKNIDFVQFDWKGNGEHEEIGVIAQDVEKISKYLVSDIKLQDGTDSKVFNNAKMIFVNAKAIQELHEIIQKQQKEINELKERIK